MKKLLIRGFVVAVVLVVIAIITVSLFLDSAVKKGVETFGSRLTKVSIKLDGVRISVLSGSGSVNGLMVGNPDGFRTTQAIGVGHASLGISPGSLFSEKIVIKHIRVEAPQITFEGGLKENNLSKILENVNAAAGGGKAKPAGPKEAGPGKKLQVDDFLIKDAKVNLSLTGMGGKVIPVTLPDIHLTNLGTGEQGITAAELTKLVFDEIVAATTKAASSDMVNNLGKQTTESLKDATGTVKGVGDLFKKKK